MREMAVRIRFQSPCLGNCKEITADRRTTGRMVLPRNAAGDVIFMATWHLANMRQAARLLNVHHDAVGAITWDVIVDGQTPSGAERWYKRWYTGDNGRRRYVLHECFPAGWEIGLNCAVPTTITDDDLWRLMQAAGRYWGLSPWRPGTFGRYDVVGYRQRRLLVPETPADLSQPAAIEKA